MRDPIDRLVSDFHHLNASSSIESIEEFANSNQEVMRFGYYADHIKNWLHFYPKDQLHIVDANDLMAEPARELAKIETFLGVQHEIVDNDFVFNNNKVSFSSTISQIKLPTTSISTVKLRSTRTSPNVNIATRLQRKSV